jgi:hypothetical protein
MLAELTNIPTHTLIELLFVTHDGHSCTYCDGHYRDRPTSMRVEKETRGPTLDVGER